MIIMHHAFTNSWETKITNPTNWFSSMRLKGQRKTRRWQRWNWRITGDKLYDLINFIPRLPGVENWLKLTNGRHYRARYQRFVIPRADNGKVSTRDELFDVLIGHRIEEYILIIHIPHLNINEITKVNDDCLLAVFVPTKSIERAQIELSCFRRNHLL